LHNRRRTRIVLSLAARVVRRGPGAVLAAGVRHQATCRGAGTVAKWKNVFRSCLVLGPSQLSGHACNCPCSGGDGLQERTGRIGRVRRVLHIRNMVDVHLKTDSLPRGLCHKILQSTDIRGGCGGQGETHWRWRSRVYRTELSVRSQATVAKHSDVLHATYILLGEHEDLIAHDDGN